MKRYISLRNSKPTDGVQYITFPTGEQHIRITDLAEYHDVVLKYYDKTGDLMMLGMAVDICRRAGVKSISLYMPFVPYARQDRIADDGDPLSIKVFANFVNSLNLDRVTILDPHSDVTSALLNNVIVIPQHFFAGQAVLAVETSLPEGDELVLVAPDIGAAKKVKALQSHLRQIHNLWFDVVQCDKTRDPKTGKITGFKVLDGNVQDKHCLLVDDICDGGGTFIGLAEVLRNEGAGPLHLYVTHGIFSKGTEVLSEHFDTITCTDSFDKTAGAADTRQITVGDVNI